MSFSGKVKDELSKQCPVARHCQIAEVAAIISLCGRIGISQNDTYSVRIHTENIAVARKYFTLLKKAYNIDTEISIRQSSKLRNYTITIKHHKDAMKVLQASKLIDEYGEICENLSVSSNILIQKECCKRAFIRGAFLASGSISDPEKFYHFEIVCTTEDKAVQLKNIIQYFNIDAKIVERKKHFVVYIKEGAGIVDILNVMEAHVALMDLENVRILKEMRNSVNRKVNCETANLKKTVSAAVKQIEDIKFIRDKVGLSVLSDNLEEMARLRLDNPDASLKELGEMLTPAVGKSGVNHRLRKICEIADDLRES
ncbi:DNA-binding protein WhiA [Bovifimicola ammoniilytica]|uniref:DNA-binding protein WhiA n=1 Tax=Bovifimicola ammoniilytica TaxID=2981720 RepID=UPI000822CDD0|nr:DNA-binding protein WhiA [Bovifimicola ammoniilytica]MCU6752416.1 DNA-binding protein WhiA [Bovifimicola ammoniilytica]SCJ24046.1 Sporulation transcription regulator WhiA [uncultured Eubacterium sp.]